MASYIDLEAVAGAWSWFEDPRAIAYNGYTYVGYNEGGDVKVSVYSSTGAFVSTATIKSALQYDDHDTPTLHVTPTTHKLVCFYAAHLGPVIYRRISTTSLDTDPDLSDGFAAETTTTFGEAAPDRFFTYPSPVFTNNSDGGGVNTTWLFTRVHMGGTDTEWHYAASTDDGAAFGSTVRLHSVTYSKIATNGTGRIDIACGEYPPDGSSKLYHLYRESTKWRKSDGTDMGAGIPFAGSDMTTVYDGGSYNLWVWDCALNSSNQPRITFVKFITATDHRYWYAAWNGSSWVTNEIAAAGSYIAGSLGLDAAMTYYSGGIVLDHEDPRIAYASIYDTDSATWEMWRYVTDDLGVTWRRTRITAGSSAKNIRPVAVRDHSDDLAVVWFYGTYTDYTNYAVGIRGAFTPVPGVWIDWNQDGFDEGSAATGSDGRLARALPEAGSAGTVNDNITPDVVSIDWTRGASSDHVGQPAPGTCTIVVKNGSNAVEPGKYTPDKSTSTLYGKLRPGLPVWIGRNADGTLSGADQAVYGVWAGYVRQIVPIPGEVTSNTLTAEIICEDPLGYYARQPSKVEDAEGRSHTALRTAVLDDIGEADTRRDLAHEIDTMPLSAADSESALRVLEDVNAATGARHFIEPADAKEQWYTYRTVTRHHKLTSATDFSLNADNIQSTQGYRVTEENVNNFQRIEVSPAHLPAGSDTVWSYVDATFPLSSKRTIWAEFDDFVTDAVLDYTSTGSAVTTTLTAFGHAAKIELWSAGSSVVQNLSIEGRQAVRDATESVTAEDTTSQVAYGRRAGPTVSSEYVGTATLGQGLADFLVWKFGTAHPRMFVSITNLFSTLNGRTLYDTLGLTFDRLYLAGRRFEIIGEQGACFVAASSSVVHWGTSYELQETANQSALDLFTFDESAFDGADVLAR